MIPKTRLLASAGKESMNRSQQRERRKLLLCSLWFLLFIFLGHPIQAAERHFEDATLHGVYFIDKQEGWAVGDEGAIWHTINAGQTWERQPSGVVASLRSVWFLNP